MNSSNGIKTVRKILGCAALPMICFFLMFILCNSMGANLFVGGISGNISSFFKNICYFSLLCFAVSINLHTGRMGFDVGAIIVLSTVIGFIVGIETGDNVVLTILASMLTGMILSVLSGLVYILLRLPMMIVSLGMTLIYEAVAYWIVRSYAYNGNVETLQLKKTVTPEICRISDDITTMIIITVASVIFMVAVFHFTKFGYDYRALQTGQKISVSTGINEVKNAVGCYIVAGLLLGAAGIVNYSYANAVQPSINFGTVSIMFECFCPLFFGTFLMKYTNKQIGILIGVISYSFIQIGLGQIQIAQNWNNYVIPLINASILVIFMIYQTNEGAVRTKIGGISSRRSVVTEERQ